MPVKRFYKTAAADCVFGVYRIALDGKPVKTPSGVTLTIPNEDLAAEVVREWAGQGEDIVPDSMPLTQILVTAQDRVGRERAAMQAAVLAYIDTDLLCYRTDLPAETARRQAILWDPWLDWFTREYGCSLYVTEKLQALEQSAAAHEVVKKSVAGLDDLRFSVLQLVVSMTGSLVLGLAFVGGVADAGRVLEAAHAEEDYKAEIYNESVHGRAPHQERSRMAARRDLEAAALLLGLL